MGVDYKAVRMYGRYFRHKSKAVEYLQETYPDAEVDDESVHYNTEEEKAIPDVLEGVILKGLNAYSDMDFIVGFELDAEESVGTYIERWNAAFPNNIDEATTHLEVVIS